MMIRPDLLKGVWQSLGLHQYLSQDDFTVQEYDNAGDPALNDEDATPRACSAPRKVRAANTPREFAQSSPAPTFNPCLLDGR